MQPSAPLPCAVSFPDSLETALMGPGFTDSVSWDHSSCWGAKVGILHYTVKDAQVMLIVSQAHRDGMGKWREFPMLFFSFPTIESIFVPPAGRDSFERKMG